MKRLILPLALAVGLSAFAQDVAEDQNVGLSQLSELAPAPGKFPLDTHEFGFMSLILNFKGDASALMTADVNREANLFAVLKRNGEVVANVPASNTRQFKFDNFMNYNWCISFFLESGYESFAGGHYQVILPEGLFLVGPEKTPSEEIIINYYMEVPQISFYPSESGNHTELQDFVITFGDAVKVERNQEKTSDIDLFNMYGEDDNIEEGESAPIDPDSVLEISAEGNKVTLHSKNVITSPGLWCFNIPAGYFILTAEDGSTSLSTEISGRYRIPTVSLEDQPAIDPQAGKVLSFPGVIELTIVDKHSLMFPYDKGANFLYTVNEDGSLGDAIADYRAAAKLSKYYYEENPDGSIDTSRPIEDSYNKVFLVNRAGEDVDIYPAPGKYQLVTTGGLYTFKIDGKITSSPSFTYNYEVVEGNLFNMQFTPAQDVALNELKDINIKFPDAEEINVTSNVAWFRSNTTNYQFYPRLSKEDPQTVILSTPVAVTMPGEYRLVTDTNSIEIDGEYVGVVANYTISESSGVKCVGKAEVMPAVFNIYNAQGLLIVKDANVEDLVALPAGIYIAGGKKFINK